MAGKRGVNVFCILMIGFFFCYVSPLFGEPSPPNGNIRTGQYALVYNGPVSAEDCPEAAATIAEQVGLKVKFLSNPAKLPQLLEGAAVFIIGGTEDELQPLLDKFTPKVLTALKNYLLNGGRYLGICGGGFLASTGWQEETIYRKGWGLIPAESSVFQNSFDARILPVLWMGKTRPMFFKAGPSFHLKPGKEPVRIVASYQDGSVAALISSFGKGRVAVCGPHPEARRSWISEAKGNKTWISSIDLAADFLKTLLSPAHLNHPQ